MIPRLLAAALQDLDQAVTYYEAEEPGLGFNFEEEVFGCIDRICRNPEAWTSISPRTRRCIVHRFPYGVIYSVGREGVTVIAVMHLKRHPDSWRNRL